uniref:Uncharacterized protein n=1 Tax=Rhizophora mucronata TaxID=61149 RepID=A0A2P2NX88_RHIMU
MVYISFQDPFYGKCLGPCQLPACCNHPNLWENCTS